MSSLSALRERIAEVVAPSRHSTGDGAISRTGVGVGVATGIAALDAVLSDGGLPRGRLTELVGARGSGRTTILRRIVERVTAERLGVAYIDARRTLAPADWAHLGACDGMWMIRPHDPTRGAWCADVLLRSGAFALVVLDGAPTLSRQIAVRLTRLARESGAAFVVLAEEQRGSALGGALRVRVERRGDDRSAEREPPVRPSWRTRATRQGVEPPRTSAVVRHVPSADATAVSLLLTAEKGGIHHTVEVSCAIGVARRLRAHPEVPDRRGVAPHAREPGHAAGHAALAPDGAPPPLRTHARARRCAEPALDWRDAVGVAG